VCIGVEKMSSPTLTDKQLKETYGLRFPEGTQGIVMFDKPFELGFSCPKGHRGVDITWSEFNEHIWCYKCNLDYPSFFCPIKRPCWMNKKMWDDMYGSHPNKFNIQKGRIHPYPDCRREDGKLHKCVE